MVPMVNKQDKITALPEKTYLQAVPEEANNLGTGRISREIRVYGVVQGVGFRPFIYRLAKKYSLNGWVLNDGSGVTIHWEGPKESINSAIAEMLASPPPLAQINGYETEESVIEGNNGFIIKRSTAHGDSGALIPADIGICSRCIEEFNNPSDKRYGYPFINCTDCGPRFTIIKGIPYDRHLTTMDKFKMCPQCFSEYQDPGNRRFHAQPNACPDCGPEMVLLDSRGQVSKRDILDIIKTGGIIAVKGLGGFHLACNALDGNSIDRLRNGKVRYSKPFALMAADMDVVNKFCIVSKKEKEILESPERPVVVLKQRENTGLPGNINPGLDSLGIMLPYTALHYLLFDQEIRLLVMTSANLSGNPIIIDNKDALEKLKGTADYFLIHSRDIVNPCDDSVGTVIGDRWQLTRRARGYVPLPVKSPKKMASILSCGSDIKNSFALAGEDKIFLSQNWGDLDNYLNYQEYQKAVFKMIKLLGIEPKLVVYDLHPGYRTTIFAEEISKQWRIPAVKVQHHHAHMASCMADNGLDEEVLAVICDGTGFGSDGKVWGFEFLAGDFKGFKRMGHLKYVPLPGGEASIRKTARMAFSFLVSTFGEEGHAIAERLLPDLPAREREVLAVQISKGLNSPLTSSCGRLFDAVAALLGICLENEYEGQGPMELETVANKAHNIENYYPMAIIKKDNGTFELDSSPLWQEIVPDLLGSKPVPDMAYRFHLGLAHGIRDGIVYMAENTGLDKVVLSGGVFQNKLLTLLLENLLLKEDIIVYSHRQVPPNDGGIALGQTFIGNEAVERCV